MSILRNEMMVASRDQGLDQRIAYDSNGNAEYIGRAQPGTADSETKWQIQKLSWTDGNMTHQRWADGTDEFIKSWTLKSTYNFLDI